jgi:hypothetical protein
VQALPGQAFANLGPGHDVVIQHLLTDTFFHHGVIPLAAKKNRLQLFSPHAVPLSKGTEQLPAGEVRLIIAQRRTYPRLSSSSVMCSTKFLALPEGAIMP